MARRHGGLRGRLLKRAALLALLLVLAALPAMPETELPAVEMLEGPDFTGADTDGPYIRYGAADALGRATGAAALLVPSMLTDDPRTDLSGLETAGLHNAFYDFIEDGWVYNRCHLIGHRFGGSPVPENLFTGTHALNYALMLPWEDRIADHLRRRGGRVLYRVTPLYEGSELVCRAVRLEALSEDGALRFAVLCPNAQPGVAIDYATGYTTLADDWYHGGMTAGPRLYVINARTGKFHLPACEEAQKISRRNRRERTCSRGELLSEGLRPCGKCRP